MGDRMTPEELEQMRADMAAGSKGPFRIIENKYDATRMFLSAMSWDRFASVVVRMAGEAENDKEGEANLRRFARLPTLEAEVLRLTEERAALSEELARMRAILQAALDEANGVRITIWEPDAIAALSHTGMTGATK